VPALGYLFHLLDAFIPSHNAFAPVIYKTIIFCLIENCGNDEVREFTIANMSMYCPLHTHLFVVYIYFIVLPFHDSVA